MSEKHLNEANYRKGFLVDDEVLAGISDDDGFTAYIVNQCSGEFILNQTFSDLESAINTLNSIDRPWKYEATAGGCGGGNCSNGNCGKSGGGCKKL